MLIAPSILSADFTKLDEQLKDVEQYGADWIHYDVMDGNFVKNITFGIDVFKAVKRVSDLWLDVHFVINDPEYYANIYLDAGADSITFHLDSLYDPERIMNLINQIKARGKKVGITARPETSVTEYLPYLPFVDVALVMSIVPGFGGQPFLPEAVEKIKWLYEQRQKLGYEYLIQVDGGINQTTAALCKDAGADCLVAGSYVFGNDMKKAIQSLKI